MNIVQDVRTQQDEPLKIDGPTFVFVVTSDEGARLIDMLAPLGSEASTKIIRWMMSLPVASWSDDAIAQG